MKNSRQITNYIINGILLISFALVISTVFIISNNLPNGIVSGKYFWFYGSVGIIFFFSLVARLFLNRSMKFSLLDLFIVLFLGVVYTSALIINNTPPNITKLTILALLVVLYFCVRFFLSNSKTTLFNQNILCFFIIITGFVEIIWGFLQLYDFVPSLHSQFKITGSFFNPGPYSGYLAVVFPLSLYYWIRLKKDAENSNRKYISGIMKWMSAIVCISTILILPAAMSRASWLATAGGSFVVLLFFCLEHQQIKSYYLLHKKSIQWLILIFVFFFTTVISGVYFLKKDSADGRLLIWKGSSQVIKKYPLGVGLGNFPGVYGVAQAEYLKSDKANEDEKYVAGSPEYAFNEYLQILIESGIFAFFLIIGTLIVSFHRLYAKKQWGIMGALTALLIFSSFSYPFSVLPFLILFVFLLAMSSDPGETSGNKLINLSLSIVLFLITSFCLYKQYSVYKAYLKWGKEEFYYHFGIHDDVSKAYEEVYPLLNDQMKFLFQYTRSLSESGDYIRSNEVLKRAMQISCDPMLFNIAAENFQALKEYRKAESNLIRSVEIVPNRIYPYFLLAKLYDEMGWKDKACEMVRIVRSKEPKIESIAIEEMRKEVSRIDCKQ